MKNIYLIFFKVSIILLFFSCHQRENIDYIEKYFGKEFSNLDSAEYIGRLIISNSEIVNGHAIVDNGLELVLGAITKHDGFSDSIIVFIKSKDRSFRINNKLIINRTYEEISKAMETKLAFDPYWGYYIKTDKKWFLSFNPEFSKKRKIRGNDTIKSVFYKRYM